LLHHGGKRAHVLRRFVRTSGGSHALPSGRQAARPRQARASARARPALTAPAPVRCGRPVDARRRVRGGAARARHVLPPAEALHAAGHAAPAAALPGRSAGPPCCGRAGPQGGLFLYLFLRRNSPGGRWAPPAAVCSGSSGALSLPDAAGRSAPTVPAPRPARTPGVVLRVGGLRGMRWGPALLGTLGTRRRQGGERRSRSKGWPRPGLVHDSAAAASWRCIAAQQLPPWLEPGCWGAEAAADGSADDRGWSDDELLARLDEVLLPGKTCMNETIKCAACAARACRPAAQPCRPGWHLDRAERRSGGGPPARRGPDCGGGAPRAGLARRAGGLDAELEWAHVLSLGEQQRIAFLHLLLHRPSLAFLDEARAPRGYS